MSDYGYPPDSCETELSDPTLCTPLVWKAARMSVTSRRLGGLVAAGLAATLALAACADDTNLAIGTEDTGDGNGAAVEFPTGTVRIVVGSGPGSTMDRLARGLAPRLQELWGQSVIVDNVPGANQSAGYHEVANADPDGHTLFITVHGLMGIHDQLGTITPGWQEFEWFGTLLEEPWAVYTAADGEIASFDDLLQLDEPVRYGDSGYESPVNVAFLTLFEAFGLDFTFAPGHDPGSAQASVLAGEQHIIGRDAVQLIRTGVDADYRALLVFSPERHPRQPDALSLSDLEELYGVSIPDQELFKLGFSIGTTPDTPPEIVDFLADSIRTLIEEDAEFQQWLDDNQLTGAILAENIGRDVTRAKVDALTRQYADFGVQDLQQRLQSGNPK
jgi:tripartite-type tricarboxylate transporter receptor subunit TctC